MAHVCRDISSEFFRKPETYTVNDIEEVEYGTVHASRLIICVGASLPQRLYETNGYAHDSILNKLQPSLRNYNLAHNSAAATLEEFSMGIFKMKDLAKLIAAGQESKVLTRLALIDAKKSATRSIVMDMDEEYKRETMNLSGVPQIIDKVGGKLVSDMNMPHTVVLGEGATGTLGGGGQSEKRDWYDYVARKQVVDLKPKLIQLAKIHLSASGKEIPEKLDVEFNSLQELTDLEKADLRLKTSQADKSDIDAGVLDPDEVALSHYGGGSYSTEIKIEPSTREENLSDGE